ncbi:MAG: carbonic anhydrase [Micavibrio sp.]|nr:MAG: carbonic anhydrase [Micavibrio sp.]
METLLEGYRKFRAETWPEKSRIFEELAEKGQKPKALVLGCVDSRANPGVIFGAGPGELLVARNVANFIPAYGSAAMCYGTAAAVEFGVRVLEIPELLVLGHQKCGGVSALLNGVPENAQEFVAPWMAEAEEARRRAAKEHDPDRRQLLGEQEVIKLSLANLAGFPWIAERVAAGRLRLSGAWFSIYSGTLSLLQEDGSFRDVA